MDGGAARTRCHVSRTPLVGRGVQFLQLRTPLDVPHGGSQYRPERLPHRPSRICPAVTGKVPDEWRTQQRFQLLLNRTAGLRVVRQDHEIAVAGQLGRGFHAGYATGRPRAPSSDPPAEEPPPNQYSLLFVLQCTRMGVLIFLPGAFP